MNHADENVVNLTQILYCIQRRRVPECMILIQFCRECSGFLTRKILRTFDLHLPVPLHVLSHDKVFRCE